MTPLFKKLNLKDQQIVLILNSPPEFKHELDLLEKNSTVQIEQNITDNEYHFIMVFARNVDELVSSLKGIVFHSEIDPVIWMVYPKKTSKNYQSDLNRDWGWEPLGKLGLKPVRAVAVDKDWSALRFRFKQFVKNRS